MEGLWGGIVGGCLAVWLVGCASTSIVVPQEAVAPPISGDKTQLLTVVTDDWDAFRGTLRRYTRTPGSAWVEIDPPIAVVVGREGHGWGRGLHGGGAPTGATGPEKREGDGRSPAGVFEIGDAYGYDEHVQGISLAYTQATSALRCVDDPGSREYNQIVNATGAPRDWKSAEHMLRDDALYAITIVVEHNTGDPEPGGGSCIFLHAWIDGNTGMSGCTAMPLHELQRLAGWLEPNAAVLVALPRPAYDSLRTAWELPE